MQRMGAVVLSLLLGLCLLTSCGTSTTYMDGSYRVEFQNYDSRGYKDFLEVTVENGSIVSLQYNAINEDELLKTDDVTYRENMQATQSTYPERFSQDLMNQYLETNDINEVDAVAGATYSSSSFFDLFAALEPQLQSGNTTTLIIENTLEK